jgi:hypothetical protein
LNTVKKFIKNNVYPLTFFLLFLQVFNLISMLIIKSPNVYTAIIPVFLFFLQITIFLSFKQIIPESEKRTSFDICKYSLVFPIVSIINLSIFFVAFEFGFSIRWQVLAILEPILLTLLFIFLQTNYSKLEVKIKLDEIYNSKNMLIEIEKEEKKSGDIVICKEVPLDQKKISKNMSEKEIHKLKPLILPFKDRFLHMLILGPTGSGKTSQIMLPMIYQDLQDLNLGVTVIEPKSDLAKKVYVMSKRIGRPALYFDPTSKDCPYFNPLYGKEEDVIENMTTTFRLLSPDSKQFFLDMNEMLLRNALRVLKRLQGDRATLIELSRLIQNIGGYGKQLVQQFARLDAETEAIAKENEEVASWFLNDYFIDKNKKTYEHCSGLRSQVAKITSNKFLRRVLNPQGGQNDINFDRHLEEGGVISIATQQGTLRDLSKYLGYFIILQLQSSVFKRKGTEFTRRPHMLYIDEFQTYSNPGFADMLTQGRSYRVASHLATQNLALMAMGAGSDGKNFVDLIKTNARNLVVFPGGNYDDALFFSRQFGEDGKTTINESINKTRSIMGSVGIGDTKTSISVKDEKSARLSPTDIIDRPAGEISYRIIKNNSIQSPGIGKVTYIPKDLNEELDYMILEMEKESLLNMELTDGVEDKTDLIYSDTRISMYDEDEEDDDDASDVLNYDKNKKEIVDDESFKDTSEEKTSLGYKEKTDGRKINKKEDGKEKKKIIIENPEDDFFSTYDDLL